MVDHIYDSLIDDEMLSALPARIAQAMGTRSATIELWEADGSVSQCYQNGYFPDEMDVAFVEEGLFKLDPWAEYFFHPSRIDRGPVRASDHLPTRQYGRTAFYNEFIRISGDDTGHCLGFASSLGGGRIVGVNVHRAFRETEFPDQDVAAMATFSAHFSRMMRIRERMTGLHRQSRLMEAAYDRLAAGVLLVDGSGKVEFANAAATSLAERADCLRIAAGKPVLTDPRANRRLQSALSARNRVGGNGDAFVCCCAHSKPWRVHVLPCDRGGASGCMILVENGEVSLDAAARLQMLYGLSPAEVRVAIGIADGYSASELAETWSVSPATIRSQLRHVFEKTHISKATQLARLIASLPPLSAIR